MTQNATMSMTAFAQIERNNVAWEIRSVNQRYLDVTFRMPEPLRFLEVALRSEMKKLLHRGKIDCVLRISAEDDSPRLDLDEPLLRALRQLESQVADVTDNSQPAQALEYLRWPGVIREPHADKDSQHQLIRTLFDEAIHNLIEMRAREGTELQRIIEDRLTQFSEMVSTIRRNAPLMVEEHQKKLRARLAELQMDADPGRLEQEMVLIAHKSDILEEIDRLDTHIAEVRKTLQQQGTIGRRLDFLMQELNREANTLSSKAITSETTLLAVDMKVVIEQMREQIQNIE
jgi:uncharacterized protein (TIGR00255 family)